MVKGQEKCENYFTIIICVNKKMTMRTVPIVIFKFISVRKPLASEVCFLDLFGLCEFCSCSGECDPSGLDYVCSVSYGKCHLSVLLYKEDRGSCLVEVLDDLEDLVYEDRGQSH